MKKELSNKAEPKFHTEQHRRMENLLIGVIIVMLGLAAYFIIH